MTDESTNENNAPAGNEPQGQAPAAQDPNGAPPAAQPGDNAGTPSDAPSGEAPSTDEGSPAAKEGSGADDNGLTGAPDAYADFAMPEGMNLDTAQLEAATPVFKELGLSQEQAQRLVDLQAQHVQAQQQAADHAFNQQLETWLDEAKADPAIGGDNFGRSVDAANKAVDAYGDQDFRTLMDQFGVGNHPAMIRMLAKIGAPLMEDVPGGGAPAGPGSDRKSILYKT